MKKSRLNNKGEMETSTEIRNWSELLPDVLGIIFKDLSLREKLTVVPSVCKSWFIAVCSPNCWQEIDLGLCTRTGKHEKLDQLVRVLIMRSHGSLSKLVATWFCTDALFSFVADNASSLQTLIIRGNDISDGIVEQVAHLLTNVRTLDLFFSAQIGPKALEAFGKNCKNLTELVYSQNRLPEDCEFNQDDEAFAIASTMPNLRFLEVSSIMITNDGVLEILSKCMKLESLDLEGCWDVTLDEHILKEEYPNLKMLCVDDGSYLLDDE